MFDKQAKICFIDNNKINRI